MKTSSAFSFAQEQPQPETTGHEAEAAKPTLRELHEQYKPIVLEAVTQDIRYRNACGHSDYENAVIEGNAAIRRAVLGSDNMGLLRLYSDTPEFRHRLHREVIDETYPKLHELRVHFRTMTLTGLSRTGMVRSRANTPLSAT